MTNTKHEKRRMGLTFSTLICLVLLGWGKPGWTGPGHDGPEEPKTTHSAPQAQRLEWAGQLYEAVGVPQSDELMLYVDEVTSNSPLVQGAVSLSLNGKLLNAHEESPGEFHAALPQGTDLNTDSIELTISGPLGKEQLSRLAADQQLADTVHPDQSQDMTDHEALSWTWIGLCSGAIVLAFSVAWVLRQRKSARGVSGGQA